MEPIRDLRDREGRAPDVGYRPDAETLARRDAAVAKLLRAGWSYRATAARLGLSYGAVQRSVERLRGGTVERPRKVRGAPRHRSRFDRGGDQAW